MFGSVLAKTLRDQRRGLVGWGVGTVALVVLMGAFWPSMRDIPDLEDFLSNYPEALRRLFDIEAITTGAGYLNTELFSIMIPAMFVIFGIGRGARLVGGEEEAGVLEVILATPVSRRRMLLGKAAAMGLSMLALGIVLFTSTVATVAIYGMEVGTGQVAAASVAMVLIGLEYGWLALAAGAATGRRSVAIAVSAIAATAGYVLFVLGRMVDAVAPWGAASPFHQALDAGPLGGGFPLLYGWMALGALAVLGAAVPTFDRRDVRV